MVGASDSNSVDALISAAAKAHSDGRLSETEALTRRALERMPQNVPAMLLLGVALAKMDRAEEAKTYLERVAKLDPRSAFAPLWLANLARNAGRLEEALRWAREAVDRNPADPMARNVLGFTYFAAGQFDHALAAFERAVAQAPQVAAIRHGVARSLQALGRHREAIAAFTAAADLDPRSPDILHELVASLFAEGETERALQHARRLLALAPNSAAAHFAMARALVEEHAPDEAEPHVRRAIELGSDDGNVLAGVGSVLQELGRIEEADELFQRSIDRLPLQGFAYFGLVQGRRITESDRPLVDRMEELLAGGDLRESSAMHLDYALGKARENLAEYEAAMRHFDEANRRAYRSKFGDAPFNRAAHKESVDLVLRTYTRSLLDTAAAGSSHKLPIFVVGMMRSGTTLTEQILSSHPNVGAAGEQRFWTERGGVAMKHSGEPNRTALNRTALNRSALNRLADEYCGLLERIAPGKLHVVDKMPSNYANVGLIRLAFPEARIVHVRRHPVDTCLSLYTTPNRARVEWANDKANLVFAYRHYLRLAEHWRSILPDDRYQEIYYEDLVNDREATTRKLIAFCGLEWDEACLHPELNERSVITPSVWQVRQPVYRTSVERWRRFEPWLGSFRELL